MLIGSHRVEAGRYLCLQRSKVDSSGTSHWLKSSIKSLTRLFVTPSMYLCQAFPVNVGVSLISHTHTCTFRLSEKCHIISHVSESETCLMTALLQILIFPKWRFTLNISSLLPLPPCPCIFSLGDVDTVASGCVSPSVVSEFKKIRSSGTATPEIKAET